MKLLTAALNLILPNQCLLCGLPTHNEQTLCQPCIAELPQTTNRCYQCGNELTGKISARQICGSCLKHPPAFTTTITAFRYQHPIDYLIAQLKFNHKLHCAKILGELMAVIIKNHYAEKLPQLIIPVPLHKKRLLTRGFNQAAELAKPIAKELNIPIDYDSCIRIKNTDPQSGLPEKQRKNNIRNSFQIIKPISIEHIAIIDDVVTTGNTVRELSKIIKRTGVKRIDIWCCAKTKPNH